MQIDCRFFCRKLFEPPNFVSPQVPCIRRNSFPISECQSSFPFPCTCILCILITRKLTLASFVFSFFRCRLCNVQLFPATVMTLGSGWRAAMLPGCSRKLNQFAGRAGPAQRIWRTFSTGSSWLSLLWPEQYCCAAAKLSQQIFLFFWCTYLWLNFKRFQFLRCCNPYILNSQRCSWEVNTAETATPPLSMRLFPWYHACIVTLGEDFPLVQRLYCYFGREFPWVHTFIVMLVCPVLC